MVLVAAGSAVVAEKWSVVPAMLRPVWLPITCSSSSSSSSRVSRGSCDAHAHHYNRLALCGVDFDN
jgi:hypothetical protein